MNPIYSLLHSPSSHSTKLVLTGVLAVFFAIKGLGGALHSTLEAAGWVQYHGPIVGGIAALFLAFFFIKFIQSQPTQRALSPPIYGNLYKAPVTWVCSILLCSAVWVRMDYLSTHPIDIKQADMLPMVEAGLVSIKKGESPYQRRILEDGRVQPGYYLPGLWLWYAVPYFLGWDIRIVNILPTIILYLVLFRVFLGTQQTQPRFGLEALTLITLLGLHAFSKLFISHTATAHTAGFDMCYPLFLWAVLTKRNTLSYLLMGTLVCTREIACFLVLPFLFQLLISDRRQFFKAVALSALMALIINLPFVLWAGSAFFDQMREYYRTFSETPIHIMLSYYGWLGVLKEMGLDALRTPLQLLGLLSAFGYLSISRNNSPQVSLALGGVAFLSFILFVSSTWAYLFVQPIVLACVLCLGRY